MLACASQGAASGPAPAQGATGSGTTSAQEPRAIVPSLPSATHYRGGYNARATSKPTDPLLAALLQNLSGNKDGPFADTRLARVATELAVIGNPGDLTMQQFLLAYHGVVEPEITMQVLRYSVRPEAQLVSALTTQLRADWKGLAPKAYGIGVSRNAKFVDVGVVWLDQVLNMDSIVRRLPASGTTVIRTVLRPGLSQPDAMLQLPAGRLGRIPVRQQGNVVTVEFRCVDGAGVYQVELVATGKEGVTVLANFPLWCGTNPPERLAVSNGTPRRGQDPVAIAADLLARLNQSRRESGLDPLVPAKELDSVALQHSAAMAKAGRAAHRLPKGGEAPDRLRAAGITARVIMENVGLQSAHGTDTRVDAQGASAAEIHAAFMASPGHRVNILSDATTHCGIGVVRALNAEGIAVFYVTELFVAY